MPIDMTVSAHPDLTDIPVSKIERNKENPRVFFRAAEMESLLKSIRKHGVQVPIAVYREHGRYVLIDGERRWRCSVKLNKDTIPALVHEKPDALGNLLLMFNIHSLREQWDLLTIALKLPRVIQLITRRKGSSPTEAEIADETGLGRAVIRRSRLLMDMPEEYRDQLIADLHRPKNQQQLSEDFFIELERAIKTVERALPEVIDNKNVVRDVLIAKYRNKVIPNLVDLRFIPKIARAVRVNADPEIATGVLTKLFHSNSYSPKEAYENSVSNAYTERDLVGRLGSIVDRLEKIDSSNLEKEVLDRLRQLARRLLKLLSTEQ